ncbi:hypothetical protein DFA_07577 [Cavenderia fasciculata]|uniref:Uncharacterized protein n=1 Tax=Cavenderia fasciculata TaxID=261658 RepID=F4PWT9_CACFS|nr:uncharacterized protein DFA_07577 [Cavenderia fasciculata]EGG20453.1 hypothetical protein DFA_07577 [Cavenderia fasciculata]|eukprot:XP_004367436.1 hypothetical protein DFA_07577 [Cavenderia fasciculata]
MKQRKNTFQFVNRSHSSNSDSNNNNNNEEDDATLDKNHEVIDIDLEETINNNTKHVTKRRKNSNNSVDSTTDNNINHNKTKDIDQQRKRSSASQFNNNNKRFHDEDAEDDDHVEEEKKSRAIYTENDLKSKLKKDLLLICQELGVDAPNNQTKDVIIGRIIKTQKDRLTFKEKMVDNNPLCDFNKGSLEYSLPWPIISRILDQVWTESSICTCYFSDRFTSTLQLPQGHIVRSQQSQQHLGAFDYYQMWPVFQPMLDEYKESRMKCPMHAYHYLNGVEPLINIYTPFIAYSRNDSNKWRYQLLGISKRVNQFLSSKNFANVRLGFTPDTWNHLNNQYCPIKAPKQLKLTKSLTEDVFANQNTSMLSHVEKISFQNILIIPQPQYFKFIIRQFKNIKSLTIPNYRMKLSFVSKFKNLTSLNLKCSSENTNRQELLDLIQLGMVKLLLPNLWCVEPISLKTELANTIQVSNIHPPNQMPNLHTFHIPSSEYNMSSFNHPNVTKLVKCDHKPSIELIVPPNISILKLTTTQNSLNPNSIQTNIFNGLNVDQLIITTHQEITDKTINSFKRLGYEYHGARFKGSTSSKRNLQFIKTTTTPDITIIKPPLEEVENLCKITIANNPTLPYYLIEKIVRYSWNSYYCTCEMANETIGDITFADYIKQSQEFIKVK